MKAFPGQQPGERSVSKKAHNDGSPQPAAKIVGIKIGAHTSHGPARHTVGKAGAGNCCIKPTIASLGHLQRAIATLNRMTHRPRQGVAASQRCGSDRFIRLSEANFRAGLEYLARPFVTLIFGLLGHPDDDCKRLHPTPAQSPISRLGHWAVGPDQIANPRTKAGTGAVGRTVSRHGFFRTLSKVQFLR